MVIITFIVSGSAAHCAAIPDISLIFKEPAADTPVATADRALKSLQIIGMKSSFPIILDSTYSHCYLEGKLA